MKKLMTALAVCAAASISLAAAGVTSANVVGYKTLVLNPNYNMLGMNFQKVGGEQQIAITNLFQSDPGFVGNADSTGATADNILTWAGSGYTPYYYRKTTAGTIGWCKTGKILATTDKIPLGAGFWFLSRNAGAVTSSVAGEVYLMTPSTNFAHVINANYNEFASAFAADMPLNDATRWDWDADGAIGSADSTGATSDNILTWAGSGYTPYYYRKTTAGTIGWCKTGKNVATTDKIPLGAGAWYLRRGTATVIHEKQAY